MTTTLKPQLFAVATSSNGTIGLITSTEMVEHTYPEGKTVKVWKGVILEDNTFQVGDETITAKKGGLWTSSQPTVLAHSSLEQMFNAATQAQQSAWAKASVANEQREETLTA